MDLNYLAPTKLLEDIYLTLCSVYEDEQHYSEEEKKAIQVTKEHLTKKVMNEFVVDEEYFLTMDPNAFEKGYGMLQHDFIHLIKGCSENNLDYDSFLQIMDQLISCAKMRMNAYELLDEKIQETKVQEAEENETEGEDEE
ncbi:hypothetical protein [Neobacillus muris]|uniref:hypothetical protein n=1 Tax=Neobacillus muris TaxID=2941334 RepID=UPI002040EAD0|nr:hypothetical protein [Neobacillus muris]